MKRAVRIPYRVPIHIKKLEEHDRIKEGILDAIKGQDFKPYTVETSYITRCDYESPKDVERAYLRLVRDPIRQHVERVMKSYGYRSSKIYNFFFQQYETQSRHDWHVHLETQWVGVYYVELPRSTPRTEYLAMTEGQVKEVRAFPCREGDVILFPSFVIHRAPANASRETKTIISFNFDCNIARRF
jgi:hypothetical protein